MKKIVYVILMTITISFALSSCTEETVAPKTQGGEGGSGSVDRGS